MGRIGQREPGWEVRGRAAPRSARLPWRVWRAAGRRLGPRRQESLLSVYAPLTLLVLLGMWLVGLLVGWSLVYRTGEGQTEGTRGYGSLLYFSGTCMLTLGFGDILAQSTALRLAALAEAGTVSPRWPWPSPASPPTMAPTGGGSPAS